MQVFNYDEKAILYLKKKDKALAAAIDKIGLIERKVIPDLFEALVNSIVGQQISMKAADTVWKRMQDRFDGITPECLNKATDEEVQQCGMSMRKASYIKNVARAVANGELNIPELLTLPDQEVCQRLCALPGIGIWTAEMLLIFSMQRPDILSWGDLAIQRGIKMLYHHKTLDKVRFEKYRRRYSPYNTVASLYLWEIAGGAWDVHHRDKGKQDANR